MNSLRMFATMIETPEKAAPITPETGWTFLFLSGPDPAHSGDESICNQKEKRQKFRRIIELRQKKRKEEKSS